MWARDLLISCHRSLLHRSRSLLQTHMKTSTYEDFQVVCTHPRTYKSNKKDIHVSKETCIYVKRILYVCQKRPVYMSKETYMYVKRDLHMWVLTGLAEAFASALFNEYTGLFWCICQKRPIYMSKETCIYTGLFWYIHKAFWMYI